MITSLVLGPAQHGVTRHGAALAGENRVDLEDVGEGARRLDDFLRQGDSPIHVHLTDHLLGGDNAAIEHGVSLLAAAERPVHLTLHDIPQPDEGEARFARRRDVYRRLVDLAASIQVCSETERHALADMTGRDEAAFGVVHLPIDLDPVTPAPGWERGPLGVLGFVHPGKNPGLAVEAGIAVGRDVELLGAVGPGHETFADDLVTKASRRGVICTITGHLSEQEMDDRIARLSVPLAPYRHVSASGSIGRWVAAGRRPVVVETPWTRELAERAPWAVNVVGLDAFEDAVRQALRDPGSTWWQQAGDGLLATQQAAQRQRELIDAALTGDSA